MINEKRLIAIFLYVLSHLSAHRASATVETYCYPLCYESKKQWGQLCNWGQCNACAECADFKTVLGCRKRCYERTNLPWKRRCNRLKQCGGCKPECDAETLKAAEEEEPEEEPRCVPKCYKRPVPWSVKCNWRKAKCKACPECNVPEVEVNEQEVIVEIEEETNQYSDTCAPKCRKRDAPWDVKCNWTSHNCKGCPECAPAEKEVVEPEVEEEVVEPEVEEEEEEEEEPDDTNARVFDKEEEVVEPEEPEEVEEEITYDDDEIVDDGTGTPGCFSGCAEHPFGWRAVCRKAKCDQCPECAGVDWTCDYEKCSVYHKGWYGACQLDTCAGCGECADINWGCDPSYCYTYRQGWYGACQLEGRCDNCPECADIIWGCDTEYCNAYRQGWFGACQLEDKCDKCAECADIIPGCDYDYCVTNRKGWASACGMADKCDGCGECSAAETNPASLCDRSYCDGVMADLAWNRKCRDEKCSGCVECSRSEEVSCMSFCRTHEEKWGTLCQWYMCAGCDRCALK